MGKSKDSDASPGVEKASVRTDPPATSPKKLPPKEIGGPKGLEPTRYGDWERKGITSDF